MISPRDLSDWISSDSAKDDPARVHVTFMDMPDGGSVTRHSSGSLSPSKAT
jgi:hypothetical protein